MKIRIMLFKNWKYVFEWVYQTRLKWFEERGGDSTIRTSDGVG